MTGDHPHYVRPADRAKPQDRLPLTDRRLNEFDADGVQTRFAISPFGNSETRAERITRWEALGVMNPNCGGCREMYEHPTLDAFMPRHKPSSFCRSGGYPHCTCPTCWG